MLMFLKLDCDVCFRVECVLVLSFVGRGLFVYSFSVLFLYVRFLFVGGVVDRFLERFGLRGRCRDGFARGECYGRFSAARIWGCASGRRTGWGFRVCVRVCAVCAIRVWFVWFFRCFFLCVSWFWGFFIFEFGCGFLCVRELCAFVRVFLGGGWCGFRCVFWGFCVFFLFVYGCV